MMDGDEIVEAVRSLVKRIYTDCFGAYGVPDGVRYDDQYEQEIKDIAKAVVRAVVAAEDEEESST